jgi:hypothetical protein
LPPEKPDLATAEGRAAYKAELQRIIFWPRTIGLSLIISAALLIVWNVKLAPARDPSLMATAYVVLGLGWAFLLIAILMRSRYHRRRLSGARP